MTGFGFRTGRTGFGPFSGSTYRRMLCSYFPRMPSNLSYLSYFCPIETFVYSKGLRADPLLSKHVLKFIMCNRFNKLSSIFCGRITFGLSPNHSQIASRAVIGHGLVVGYPPVATPIGPTYALEDLRDSTNATEYKPRSATEECPRETQSDISTYPTGEGGPIT
jgi:hypothetical protein